MTGIQITIDELCTSCNNNDDCFKEKLWEGLDMADGSYSCINHLPREEDVER